MSMGSGYNIQPQTLGIFSHDNKVQLNKHRIN